VLPWDYRVHVTTLAAAKTVAGPLIHGLGSFFQATLFKYKKYAVTYYIIWVPTNRQPKATIKK